MSFSTGKESMATQQTRQCLICLEDTAINNLFGLSCGHSNVCKSCWTDYLLYQIKTKLLSGCPSSGCYQIIPLNVWQSFLSIKYKNQYHEYCSMINPNNSNSSDSVSCDLCSNHFLPLEIDYASRQSPDNRDWLGYYCNYCLSKAMFNVTQREHYLFISITTKNHQKLLKISLSYFTTQQISKLFKTKVFNVLSNKNCINFLDYTQIRHDLSEQTDDGIIDDFIQSLKPQFHWKVNNETKICKSCDNEYISRNKIPILQPLYDKYCIECIERLSLKDKQNITFPDSGKLTNIIFNLWSRPITKCCPKCGAYYGENRRGYHATCRKHAGGCGHEFCWGCLGDWSFHGSATGGYYQCIYEKKQMKAFNKWKMYVFKYYWLLQTIGIYYGELIKAPENWRQWIFTDSEVKSMSENVFDAFIEYQRFKAWKGFGRVDNNYDDKDFLYSCYDNFYSNEQNMNLLFYGFMRRDIDFFIPVHIMIYCMKFCYKLDKDVNDKWDDNALLPNDPKAKMDFYEFVYGNKYKNRFYDKHTRFGMQGQFVRKIWKLKVMRKCSLEIAILRQYTRIEHDQCMLRENCKHVGCGCDKIRSIQQRNDFHDLIGIKEQEIENEDEINILFIHYESHFIVRFGLNGNFKTINNGLTICHRSWIHDYKPKCDQYDNDSGHVFRLSVKLSANGDIRILQ